MLFDFKMHGCLSCNCSFCYFSAAVSEQVLTCFAMFLAVKPSLDTSQHLLQVQHKAWKGNHKPQTPAVDVLMNASRILPCVWSANDSFGWALLLGVAAPRPRWNCGLVSYGTGSCGLDTEWHSHNVKHCCDFSSFFSFFVHLFVCLPCAPLFVGWLSRVACALLMFLAESQHWSVERGGKKIRMHSCFPCCRYHTI